MVELRQALKHLDAAIENDGPGFWIIHRAHQAGLKFISMMFLDGERIETGQSGNLPEWHLTSCRITSVSKCRR